MAEPQDDKQDSAVAQIWYRLAPWLAVFEPAEINQAGDRAAWLDRNKD
jgi:hypothetical protein